MKKFFVWKYRGKDMNLDNAKKRNYKHLDT